MLILSCKQTKASPSHLVLAPCTLSESNSECSSKGAAAILRASFKCLSSSPHLQARDQPTYEGELNGSISWVVPASHVRKWTCSLQYQICQNMLGLCDIVCRQTAQCKCLIQIWQWKQLQRGVAQSLSAPGASWSCMCRCEYTLLFLYSARKRLLWFCCVAVF